MRTIIERHQRLMKIKEQYEEAILDFARDQLAIEQKVLKDLKLTDDWHYRDRLHYDFLRVNGDNGSTVVELWETGRCGDSDTYLSEFYVSGHMINGDAEQYEQSFRAMLKQRAEEVEQARQKANEKKREQLRNDMTRIANELAKLGG